MDLMSQMAFVKLLNIRRGGILREDAIAWFYTVERQDSKEPDEEGETETLLAFGWTVKVLANDYSDALPEADRNQAARRGFCKALDNFVYRPGTTLVLQLVSLMKTCIKNELRDALDEYRRGKGRSSGLDEQLPGMETAAECESSRSLDEIYESLGSNSLSSVESRCLIERLHESLNAEQLEMLNHVLLGAQYHEIWLEDLRDAVRKSGVFDDRSAVL